MPTIVLRDQQQHDVGFLLLAGSEGVGSAGERDVVLMALPTSRTSDIGNFLQEFKHVEFRARVVSSEAGSEVFFTVAPNVVFRASLAPSGVGRWTVDSAGNGSCQVLGGG